MPNKCALYLLAVMFNNVVYPTGNQAYNPPGYSAQPPAAPPPQSAYKDPGYGQYPPPAPPYAQPGYGGAPAPPPQQPAQQQQQQVVIVGGGQSQPSNVQSFMGHMVLACFVMWCCNFLFGLVAFILASKYNKCLSIVGYADNLAYLQSCIFQSKCRHVQYNSK